MKGLCQFLDKETTKIGLHMLVLMMMAKLLIGLEGQCNWVQIDMCRCPSLAKSLVGIGRERGGSLRKDQTRSDDGFGGDGDDEKKRQGKIVGVMRWNQIGCDD